MNEVFFLSKTKLTNSFNLLTETKSQFLKLVAVILTILY